MTGGSERRSSRPALDRAAAVVAVVLLVAAGFGPSVGIAAGVGDATGDPVVSATLSAIPDPTTGSDDGGDSITVDGSLPTNGTSSGRPTIVTTRPTTITVTLSPPTQSTSVERSTTTDISTATTTEPPASTTTAVEPPTPTTTADEPPTPTDVPVSPTTTDRTPRTTERSATQTTERSTTRTTDDGDGEGSPGRPSPPGGPPDDAPGNGPPEDAPGNGPPEDAPGNGPPEDAPGNGPPEDAPGNGPPSAGPPEDPPGNGPPGAGPPDDTPGNGPGPGNGGPPGHRPPGHGGVGPAPDPGTPDVNRTGPPTNRTHPPGNAAGRPGNRTGRPGNGTDPGANRTGRGNATIPGPNASQPPRPDVNVTVENATANAPVSVNVSSASDTGDDVTFSSVNVTPTRNASFSMNVTASGDPIQGKTPSVDLSNGTRPLAYLSVDHSIADRNVSDVTFTVRVRTDRVNASERDDVALYRFHGGTWNELPTTLVRTTGNHYVYRVRSPGLSEFAAGKKRPDFEITDAEVIDATLSPGDALEVRVRVANRGEADGTFTPTLRLDGESAAHRKLTIAAGGMRQATFETALTEPGTYAVSVDDHQVDKVTVTRTAGGRATTAASTAADAASTGTDAVSTGTDAASSDARIGHDDVGQDDTNRTEPARGATDASNRVDVAATVEPASAFGVVAVTFLTWIVTGRHR